jgi:endoglucanase
VASCLVAGALAGPVPVSAASAGPARAQAEVSGRALAPGPPLVRVQGNELVDARGQDVRLVGVDRSGTEYACTQGWGIFDGPSDQSSLATMASWGINVVRVPLNEDCWLGVNGIKAQYGGPRYRQAIEDFVHRVGAQHMMAVLDLHWSAPGSQRATGQQVMADSSHSPAFWSSVATAFRSDTGVIFDLYNEPHDISWACWLKGCTIAAQGRRPAWQAAGMQELVNVVRRAGATQPVLIGGLGWSGDLTGWLAHQPVDPLHQEIADIHVYNFAACATTACWDAEIVPLSAHVPVMASEVGQDTCDGAFADRFFGWADARSMSYLAWTWDTWGCPEGLVKSYSGAPTAWGATFHAHLDKLHLVPLVGTATPS